MQLSTASAGNQAVMSDDLPTVNDLLNLLSEAGTEIANIDSRHNVVAQRIWRTVHAFDALESTLDRAIRVSEGGRDQ